MEGAGGATLSACHGLPFLSTCYSHTVTHLTAVSGANVTIVCGAVLVSARVVGPRVAVALAALALVGFVIVVQPSASVLVRLMHR